MPTSCTIVHYYAISYFVYFGGPPTAMDAILATIVGGRRAIIVIDTESVEIN